MSSSLLRTIKELRVTPVTAVEDVTAWCGIALTQGEGVDTGAFELPVATYDTFLYITCLLFHSLQFIICNFDLYTEGTNVTSRQSTQCVVTIFHLSFFSPWLIARVLWICIHRLRLHTSLSFMETLCRFLNCSHQSLLWLLGSQIGPLSTAKWLRITSIRPERRWDFNRSIQDQNAKRQGPYLKANQIAQSLRCITQN